MRDISATLLAAQQGKSPDPAIKITLSKTGVDDIVLEEDRLRRLTHIEEPWRVNAKEAEFDNSDGYFTNLDVKGWKAVISWGLVTKAGKEYSDTSPLRVTWQQLNSTPGRLSCLLTMLGIPDIIDLDQASESYIPDEDDNKTVKTLTDSIADASIACYTHCQAYDVVWEDGYDGLADTYKPKDSFRIYIGGSRLAAIKRLMEYTGNVLRFEKDGKLHILKPVTTGEVYDYQWSLESGHPFLSKAYRKTLILPNRIVVRSRPDDDPQYSGSAQVDGYDDLPAEVKKTKYIQTRLQSHAEAGDIAEAVLSRYELNAEMGSADALMNCGAELFDYVEVNAFNAQDVSRIGNIGSLTRTYNAEKRIYNMRFSFGDPPVVQHIKDLYQDLSKAAEREGASFERLYAQNAYIENLSIDQINAVWLDPDSNIDLSQIGDTLDNLPDGENFARVKTLHLSALGGIKLDENIIYTSGYDPMSDNFGEKEGVSFQRIIGTHIDAGKIKVFSETVFDGVWYSASGVDIDAASGINIYGVANALTTRATIDGPIQCYVGADGKIYAGAGAVSLDASGIHVRGENLNFYYGDSLEGQVFAYDGGLTVLGNIFLQITTAGDGGITVKAGGYGTAPTADDLRLEAVADIFIDAADDVFFYAGDNIAIRAGMTTAGNLSMEAGDPTEHTGNVYLRAWEIGGAVASYINILGGGDIELGPEGNDIIPGESGVTDLGTDSVYYDVIECVTLDDSHSPTPGIVHPLEAIRNMRTTRRKITLSDIAKEHLGKCLRKRVEDAGGVLEMDWQDKDTFPEEILRRPTEESYAKAKGYNERKRREYEERGLDPDSFIPVEPVVSTSIFDEIWLLVSGIQELADKVEALEGRKR